MASRARFAAINLPLIFVFVLVAVSWSSSRLESSRYQFLGGEVLLLDMLFCLLES